MESASIAARPRARRAPRAADGEPILAGRRPAARHAALHHLGGHALRSVLHGLLLHAGREGGPVARARHRDSRAGRGLQHRRPDLVELHHALGARWPRRTATAPACGRACSPPSSSGLTFLTVQINEYVHLGWAPRTTPRVRSSTASPACTERTSTVGLILLLFANIRANRGHFSPRSTAASRCPASTGTSWMSCGSWCSRRCTSFEVAGRRSRVADLLLADRLLRAARWTRSPWTSLPRPATCDLRPECRTPFAPKARLSASCSTPSGLPLL